MTGATYTDMKPFPDQRPAASGLYITEARKAYFFEQLAKRAGHGAIKLGSAKTCHIQLHGENIERVHAVIESRHGVMHLRNCSRSRELFVDDWQVVRPVPMLVGMIIHVVDVQLVAVNERGTFGVYAESVSELCRKAYKLRGSHRLAGKMVGRSHNFVRKQFEPRSRRFAKADPCSSTD